MWNGKLLIKWSFEEKFVNTYVSINMYSLSTWCEINWQLSAPKCRERGKDNYGANTTIFKLTVSQDTTLLQSGKSYQEMDSYIAGKRKRTLSSDTTDSSENEDGGVSPTYNFYGKGGASKGKAKVARRGNCLLSFVTYHMYIYIYRINILIKQNIHLSCKVKVSIYIYLHQYWI